MRGVRYNWTAAMDAYIRRNWGKVPPREIVKHLGVGKTALKGRLKKLGLPTAGGFYHKWSPEERLALFRLYPDTPTEAIAEQLGISIDIIYRMANKLGLKKSEAFLASDHSGRLTKLSAAGEGFRFPKGHVPANKGKKGTPSVGRMAETQFKKGDRPHTWRPVGTMRVSKEGYLQIKLRDSGVTRRDYVAIHHLVWELHHGPIPPGHKVAFCDGNPHRERIDPSNLELISDAEMMRRNSVHRYPKGIAQLMQLRGAINRKINKRMKANERQQQHHQ